GGAGGDGPSSGGYLGQARDQALLAVHGQPAGRDQRRDGRRHPAALERQALEEKAAAGGLGLDRSQELPHADAGGRAPRAGGAAALGQVSRVATRQEPEQPRRGLAAALQVASAAGPPGDRACGSRLRPDRNGSLLPAARLSLRDSHQAGRLGAESEFYRQTARLSREKRD